MKRYGMVIGLRADKLDEYKQLHAAVWPDVLKMIKQPLFSRSPNRTLAPHAHQP